MRYSIFNRTQHASQRCGPRWVNLLAVDSQMCFYISGYFYIDKACVSQYDSSLRFLDDGDWKTSTEDTVFYNNATMTVSTTGQKVYNCILMKNRLEIS